MILYLDASDNQKTIVRLDNYQLIKKYDSPSQQKILETIVDLLVLKKINPQQISEIKINPGPGSYTSLRVACAVVNVLAWALKIKVNGKKQIIPVYELES